MKELIGHLKNKYKEQLAIINDVEYIKLEVLERAVYELAFSDALVGAIVNKYGTIEISDEELVDFMDKSDTVDIITEKGKTIIKRNDM